MPTITQTRAPSKPQKSRPPSKPRENNQLQFFKKAECKKHKNIFLSISGGFWPVSVPRWLEVLFCQVLNIKNMFFLFATPGRTNLLIRVPTEKNNKDLYMPPSRHTCYIRPKCPSSKHPTQPANRPRLHSRHPTQPAN